MAHTVTPEDRTRAQGLLTDAASQMKAAISQIHGMGFDVNYTDIRKQINVQYAVVTTQVHKSTRRTQDRLTDEG